MTPSAIIPQSVVQSRISARAKIVWGQLSYHRNRTTGQCNPRYSTLARELQISEDTVGRAVRELTHHGFVVPTKHIRASSFELHTQPIENPQFCGRKKPQICGVKKPQTCKVRPPASLYEPELLNLNSLSESAVPTGRILEEPEPAAAAAPLVCVKTEERQEPPAPVVLEPEPVPPASLPPTFLPSPVHAQAEALVEELHAVHPQPGLPDRAVPEVEKILAASQDVDATIERIRTNHAAWRLHWDLRRPGQFIPQLWRWFRDGEWKRCVGKPVKYETYYEKVERAQKEYKMSDRMKEAFEEEEREYSERNRALEEWRERQKGFKRCG